MIIMIWRSPIFSNCLGQVGNLRPIDNRGVTERYHEVRRADFQSAAGYQPAQRRGTCVLAAALLIVILCGMPVRAATVTGHVDLVLSQDPNVRKHLDYSGVVVWLEPLDVPPTLPHAKHAEMVQKNKTFIPHVLGITLGTTVDFPNRDPIFHNAFSNYNGQIFDVSLYPPGTSRSITFQREGVVRVFCNIHPAMSAVIVVLRSPYFCVSSKNGALQITGVPPGSYRVHVFHERATEQTLSALTRVIEVTTEGAQLAPISVSESGYLQLPHKNKYGKDYPALTDSGSYAGPKP
jgi:plastocyanin